MRPFVNVLAVEVADGSLKAVELRSLDTRSGCLQINMAAAVAKAPMAGGF